MDNYYKILGVNDFASLDEIKIAYKKLAKRLHPDVNDGDKFFEEKFDGVCFEKSKVYMDAYLVRYRHELLVNYCNEICRFKAAVILKLNSFHPDKKKTTEFESSLNFAKAISVDETLVLVLREFGPTIFNSIFPL